MRFRSTFFFLCFLSACGSGSTSGPSDGGLPTGPGTPAAPIKLPDGTTVPTVACGNEAVTSASGTWDVVQSGKFSLGTAVITIDSTSFVVASDKRTLSFSVTGGAMALHWTDTDPVSIAVTRADSAVDTGLLPLSIGGAWTFKGPTTESCSASLSASAFNTTCRQVRHTPFGRLDGTVVGIRREQHPSLFGELGGTWHLTGEGSATVDATISGNTFTAVVNGENGGPVGGAGWVTVKVCNGTAAGKASSGIELAATRR